MERFLVLLTFMLVLAGCGQPLRGLPVGSASQSLSNTPPVITPSPSNTPRVEAAAEPPASGIQASAPTRAPAAVALPPATPPAVTVRVPPTETVTNEALWRRQQGGREVFAPKVFIAEAPLSLLWYDPKTGQSLEIGTLYGPFTAQARFTFLPKQQAALEVPYRINVDFGLTAISPAVQERMNAAGYTKTVEAYVLFSSDAIKPQS